MLKKMQKNKRENIAEIKKCVYLCNLNFWFKNHITHNPTKGGTPIG